MPDFLLASLGMTIHAHLFAVFPDVLLDTNQITVGGLDRDHVTFVELSDTTTLTTR